MYQKDNKGFEFTMEYDATGRITKKTRLANTTVIPAYPNPEVTDYAYVFSGFGQEQLYTVSVDNNIKQTYGYNSLHLPNSYTESVDGTVNNTFTTTTEYYNNNALKKITYPNNFILNYTYQKGVLKDIKDGNNTTIYTTNSTNKYNQPTQYLLGNGQTSNIDFNVIGSPTRYYTQKAGTSTFIQDLNMEYDGGATSQFPTGNLTKRIDKTKGFSPNYQNDIFTYENTVDRLKTMTTYGGSLQTMNYDNAKNGNITNKPDGTLIGTYAYDATKIHAVSQINYTCTGTALNYREGQTINYTPFNQPDSIRQRDTVGTGSPTPLINLITYTYNPDEQRNRSKLEIGGVIKNMRYYHGNYERLDTYTSGSVSSTKHIYYIQGGNGLCAIATKDNAATTPTYYYVYTDHLGSILKLTDNTATTSYEQSFDAWGRLRSPTTWSSYSYAQPTNSPFGAGGLVTGGGWLTRGYTGHEHLPQVDLINMNGRLYDAVVGRMLSPDNFVSDATNTQAYNRYSYVMNNPLKYIDPSGWNPVKSLTIINNGYMGVAGYMGDDDGNNGGWSEPKPNAVVSTANYIPSVFWINSRGPDGFISNHAWGESTESALNRDDGYNPWNTEYHHSSGRDGGVLIGNHYYYKYQNPDGSTYSFIDTEDPANIMNNATASLNGGGDNWIVKNAKIINAATYSGRVADYYSNNIFKFKDAPEGKKNALRHLYINARLYQLGYNENDINYLEDLHEKYDVSTPNDLIIDKKNYELGQQLGTQLKPQNSFCSENELMIQVLYFMHYNGFYATDKSTNIVQHFFLYTRDLQYYINLVK